ncbi:hypothetical protein G6011_07645 [Alternaria panax]|uniref:RING-type domain-containing protein n=1 Tax=Alternaria panax TaxID=48097 RepID=A0AAD4F916_9PLEO|nr:hypothetical protein G6011_07645 [Alternaria panax]
MIDHHQDVRSFSRDLSTLNQYLNELLDRHRFLISDPFSNLTLALRQQLASCDIRGTARLLVRDVATLSDRTPYTGLPWDMFKNFVDGLIHVVNALEPVCIGRVRTALFMLRLNHFLDPNATKDNTWTWLPDEWEDEYESDGKVDPDDLLKYEFTVIETLGLPEEDWSICRDTLNVQKTVREEVSVKVDFSHTFHYGCVSTLVNGVFKFSNLCPNCRQKVCHRRRRRLKDNKELESTQISEVQDEVEPGHFLQDRYGEVVMMDE